MFKGYSFRVKLERDRTVDEDVKQNPYEDPKYLSHFQRNKNAYIVGAIAFAFFCGMAMGGKQPSQVIMMGGRPIPFA